ncbi:DNA internalization-related competence protein ComEC/Rec2 [Acinetobacter qingfengensis]|uniref:DNA internalization-related competence protein ComEC/Rec2 n=1 Tax=Acinetobacter qingfengensis TaxID=1262585 RepID=A0A1E7RFC4_9GAMM|nr:DNA internalization-related competence protein ComEC/Rec2 [Acinetobacter qingfengensis]KAA8731818.1 DNA internalization-related competence protein ComEC/Rec2 [Acinetobacter qingfengensis]OEY98058.1 DNA internalization-related competence protein ComEC/Rec2 [Acinetobacter qingfengensis]
MIRCFLLAWILGISAIGLTDESLNRLTSVWWWPVAILTGCGYYFLWCKSLLQPHAMLRIMLQMIMICSVFLAGWSYADQQLKQYLASEIKQKQQIEGIVYIQQLSEGKLQQQRQVAQLLIPQQQRSLKILLYPKQIYDEQGELQGTTTENLQIGQFYQVTVELRPPQGNVNPGGFDTERWLLQQNIQGTASVRFSQPISVSEIEQRGWYQFVQQQKRLLPRWQLWIERLRLDYRNYLTLNQQDQERALLLGLLTGDRIGINKDTTQLYQTMGISHLLAISGPHVLLLAAMLSWVLLQGLQVLMRLGHLQKLYLKVPKQWVYLPVFLLTISFYVAFTGFEIPAIRTWLMATICSLALLLNIHISRFTLLLFAASCVLLWDSFAILSAAFWLSFGASAVMLFIYQGLQQPSIMYSWWEKCIQALLILWQSQWRIFLALLPIVLWQFKAVSLVSPLINLIAIPFLTLVIVPLDIVAACVWQIWPGLASLVWSCAALALYVFNMLLTLFEPVAKYLYLSSFLTFNSLLSLSMALLLICLPSGLIPRYWAILFLIPILFQQQARPMLQLDVLDVGQGQAVLLRTQRHQMLIDTAKGNRSSAMASMAQQQIVPFLRGQGIYRLHEVLLSHLDDDHSGGLATVVEQMKVQRIRANVANPEITDFPGIPFSQCYQGQNWQWEQVKIDILHPSTDDSRQDQNESSCVVLISVPMQQTLFRILIMGDAGWESEYKLLQRYPDLQVDLIVLGHHGSKYSSAYEFLQALNPKMAMISVGAENRYGHPTAEVLARLQDLDIYMVDTINAGAIHIQLNDPQHIWQWSAARDEKQWLLP